MTGARTLKMKWILVVTILILSVLGCAPVVPSLIEREASWVNVEDANWQLAWKDTLKQESTFRVLQNDVKVIFTSRAMVFVRQDKSTALFVLSTPDINLYGSSLNPFALMSDEELLKELALRAKPTAEANLGIQLDLSKVTLANQGRLSLETSLGTFEGSTFLTGALDSQEQASLEVLRGRHEGDLIVLVSLVESPVSNTISGDFSTNLRHPTAEPAVEFVSLGLNTIGPSGTVETNQAASNSEPADIGPTEPTSTHPSQMISNQEDLIRALENLRDAMLGKIDSDIDATAEAFTSVEDYRRIKRWADIFTAPLRVLAGTLSILATATDFRSLNQDVATTLDGAEAAYQVTSTVLMLHSLWEAGEQLQFGLDGPVYVRSIETMLEDADLVNPPLGFDPVGYKRTIKNHLYGAFQDQPGPLVIPRKSTEVGRQSSEFARGAFQVRKEIELQFNHLIAELKTGELVLQEDFPTGEVVSQLSTLQFHVIRSRGFGSEIRYKTVLKQGNSFVLREVETNLGATGVQYQLFGRAAGEVDKSLKIQQDVEIVRLFKAGEDAVLLYTVTRNLPGGEEIKIIQKATVLGEVTIQSYNHSFSQDVEEMFYMSPQEMVLSLPIELSNLWMIADDTIQYLRQGSITMNGNTFGVGDTVEVFDTGASGLVVRGPTACGSQIGGKFDGDIGRVIEGPVLCSSYYRFKVQWSDGLIGWSGEDWLQKTVDTTKPKVDSLSVRPSSTNGGNSFNIFYAVSDAGGSGLKQVELWRAPDSGGTPGSWAQVISKAASGISSSGSFTDTFTLGGGVWYGIHAVDNAGNWAPEDAPLKVTVTSSSVTLTLYVRAGSTSGPVLVGARVTGQDANGVSFNQTTNSGGFVIIAGAPGNWGFVASKSGYQSESWSQDISTNGTKTAFLQ